MKEGLPAKLLLLPGIIIFVALFSFFSFHFDPQIFLTRFNLKKEYEKDQTYLKMALKTKLPEEPLNQVQYQAQGYRCPGCCLVGAGAGLAHYYEPDIDFDAFIAYGIPTIFYAEEKGKTKRFGPGFDVWRAFANLGYTAYRGKPSPIHPPQIIFPTFNPQNYITFQDKDEEILFIKKLLSAGNIPIIPWGDFLMVTGFNENDRDNLWFSSQTNKGSLMEYPPLLTNSKRKFADWVQAWGSQGGNYHPENYVFYWVEKVGPRKTVAEILKENKLAAQEAPAKMQKAIDYLKSTGRWGDFISALNVGNVSTSRFEDYSASIDIPMTAALSRYLRKLGYGKLADQYWEIAKIYDQTQAAIGNEPDSGKQIKLVIETLVKVKPLAEQAAALWP